MSANPAHDFEFAHYLELFTWLSLVVSLMASFVLFFFPLDVLDEIWDLKSVSEGFLPVYSLTGSNYWSE